MSDYTPDTADVRDNYTIGEAGWDQTLHYGEGAYAEFDRWLAARDEEKFLEGARWALRAEGIEDVDRAIENIRDAQAVEEEA